MSEKKGKLYLIPCPLGEDAIETIPAYVIELIHKLDVFIAERARTARRFIKSTQPSRPISDLQVFELDKHAPNKGIEEMLDDALNGKDIGLLSEAGCPAVADPGSEIVRIAHQKGIEIVPLVGPSSILLALMASGMNGQNFAFHGYLPAKKPELSKRLKQLEQESKRTGQTQIFIETPYRNEGLLEQITNLLSPSTRFCIAADLTLETEYISSRSIKDWQKGQHPNLHKRPALFLLNAKNHINNKL